MKAAIVAVSPGTHPKDWKRRTKTKVPTGVERIFDGPRGLVATTVEMPDGTISVFVQPGSEEKAVPKPEPKVSVKADKPAKASGKLDIKTLRSQMVETSVWKVVKDTDITMWHENPVFRHLVNSTYRNRTPTQQAEINRMQDAKETMQISKVATLRAGTVLTVVGVVSGDNWVSSNEKEYSNGLRAPCKITEGEIELASVSGRYGGNPLNGYRGPAVFELPLKQIIESIEPVSVPETLVYVLRDNATGEFFGGWKFAIDSYGQNRSTDDPKMGAKFSSAKKYKTSSAVKASIRDFTGYNEGLDNVDSGPDWTSGGSKKMDLPPTWEMVSFDKTTSTEKEVFEVQEWFAALGRLRVLTVNYGSAARAVYKKAEGKGYQAILVFQNRSRGSYDDWKGNHHAYDEANTFDDDQSGRNALDAILEAIKVMDGKNVREKSASSVAVACSVADAIKAKLVLDVPEGSAVLTKLLDFNTLEEVVETQS